jgi:CHAD domain-containing protein
MGDPHLERERKFDVPPDFELPQLPAAGRRSHDLRASYFDTDDALLQTRGVTLRRRVGGADEGWHLKIPHPEGRLELHADPGPTRPPRELTSLVRGLRFDRPLRRRAVLRTKREEHRLSTAQGELEAEVVDDRVSATVDLTGETVQWREVEIELGPAGTDDTMARLTEVITDAGAWPSEFGSKYARAVGEASAPSVSSSSGLAELVDDYLQTQYERLSWGDLRMRRGEDAVHKTRVAVRRTRSTLRIFASMFDDRRAAHLDSELKWYAAALGAVRDLDILGRQLEADIDNGAGELFSVKAAEGLRRAVEADRRQHWERLLAILNGQRYGDLLHELDQWRHGAPWTPEAEASPGDVEKFLERAHKKSDKRLRQARSADEDSKDDAIHRARKAAKRTRYAAELARPAMGKPAKRIAKTHEKRQDALGEIQDHRMAVTALTELGVRPDVPADVSFTAGVLAQRHDDGREHGRRSV